MRLHLVDGTYELFRAHYGRTPPRTAPDGRDVKATVGVVSTLVRYLTDEDEQVTHLAVAFDNPIESFRNDLFDGYKDSSGMEEALLAQFDLVEQAVASLGVTVWSMDRWEADDALATGARRFADEVDQVRIMTPDKDLGQAVVGDRVVQVDSMRGRVFDEAGVVDRLGVAPSSVPDYLALVGDSADGIPGLAGFGAKSTATLLQAYGDLDAIPDDAEQWSVRPRGAQRLAETLAAHRDEARLYRRLATLVDVPLSDTLEELRWRGAPRDRFVRWADQLGVTSLRERVPRWAD